MKNKNATIVSRKFSECAVPEAANFQFKDYLSVSEGGGYYYREGVLRSQGWKYFFRDFLRKFMFRNGGNCGVAYALSPTDLKRVLRAHYFTVHGNFLAVDITDK